MAKKNPEVQGTAPFVAAQGMLVRGEALSGVQIRGIDPALERAVSDVAGQMIARRLDALVPGSFSVVLGTQTANLLGGGVGATVLVREPLGPVSLAGTNHRLRHFPVT